MYILVIKYSPHISIFWMGTALVTPFVPFFLFLRVQNTNTLTHHLWRLYLERRCASVTCNPRRRIWQTPRRSWSESLWSWLWWRLCNTNKHRRLYSVQPDIDETVDVKMNMQKASVLKSIKGALIQQFKVWENAFVCVSLVNLAVSVCVIAPVYDSTLLTYNSCCWICCSWRRRLAHQTPLPEKNRSAWLPRSRPATQNGPGRPHKRARTTAIIRDNCRKLIQQKDERHLWIQGNFANCCCTHVSNLILKLPLWGLFAKWGERIVDPGKTYLRLIVTSPADDDDMSDSYEAFKKLICKHTHTHIWIWVCAIDWSTLFCINATGFQRAIKSCSLMQLYACAFNGDVT